MCDGFSEAFMAAAEAGSAAAGEAAVALPATAEASLTTGMAAGEAGMSTAASVGASAGAGLGAIGTSGALAIGSAAMSGYSAYAQSSASQAAAAYQAQIDRNNALLAGYQQSAALQQGQLQMRQSMLQQSQALGQQRATLAANGVALDSGSALDQMAITRFLGAQDVNTLQSNAARAAWGYGVEAGNSQAQATLHAWQNSNTSPVGIAAMSGASSLLSSASLYAMGRNTNLFNALIE